MIYSLGLMLGVGVIAGIFGAILGIGGGIYRHTNPDTWFGIRY